MLDRIRVSKVSLKREEGSGELRTSFSRSRLSAEMNMGKYAFLTLIVLICSSNQAFMLSHIAYEAGSRM